MGGGNQAMPCAKNVNFPWPFHPKNMIWPWPFQLEKRLRYHLLCKPELHIRFMVCFPPDPIIPDQNHPTGLTFFQSTLRGTVIRYLDFAFLSFSEKLNKILSTYAKWRFPLQPITPAKGSNVVVASLREIWNSRLKLASSSSFFNTLFSRSKKAALQYRSLWNLQIKQGIPASLNWPQKSHKWIKMGAYFIWRNSDCTGIHEIC